MLLKKEYIRYTWYFNVYIKFDTSINVLEVLL
jgi:hypothetical protein